MPLIIAANNVDDQDLASGPVINEDDVDFFDSSQTSCTSISHSQQLEVLTDLNNINVNSQDMHLNRNFCYTLFSVNGNGNYSIYN